ncbi:MAG TPA: hypothetical protein VHW09_05685 [Bryobacteraceae bacterium]|jgi:hypothetical protein|nr:hypothetical protein [Bryobacteraceae bacterium]
MPSAALFLSFFQGAAILGSILTVGKLLTSHLYRRYRIFFLYFIFRITSMTWFLVLSNVKGLAGGDGTNSNMYFYSYLIIEPILLLAYILVVIELYSLVLEKYRGLYTLGRWAMYAAILISGTVSILTFIPKINPLLPEPSKRLMLELAAERGIDLALVLFILLIVWFLSKYPVPLSRNVVVHTVIYAIFFLSDTMLLLWRSLLGENVTPTANVVATAISAACSFAWAILLTDRGEEVRAQLPQIRAEAEERILHQLDALNATLLKVSRK